MKLHVDEKLSDADWPKKTPDRLSDLEPVAADYDGEIKPLEQLAKTGSKRLGTSYNKTYSKLLGTKYINSRLKHLGPGNHPNGSPQSVHAGSGSRGGISEVEAIGLAALLKSTGGFTYHPLDDNSPKGGFAVSVFPNDEAVFPDGDRTAEAITKDVFEYMKQRRERFENPQVYIGGWHDVEAKKIYLDLSVVEPDRQKAIALARKHNQEAVFDLGKFDTVIVKQESERRKTKPASKTHVYVSRPLETDDESLKQFAAMMGKAIKGNERSKAYSSRLGTRYIKTKDNCGANAPGGGGFQPGNDCASGGGGADLTPGGLQPSGQPDNTQSASKEAAKEESPESADANTPGSVQRLYAESLIKEPIATPRGEVYHPDVEFDGDGDGVTDYARVGVAAHEVPPPPTIPRLPNLTPEEQVVQEHFAQSYEQNTERYETAYRDMVTVASLESGKPPTFETDGAKNLSPFWSDHTLSKEEMLRNRAVYNTPLHQTANAIAKRAFVKHLDSLKKGDQVLVTVGGVGAGKGYALENVPEVQALAMQSKAVWDSAGDQNATENAWVQKELDKRGLKGLYVHVHADPNNSWANPKFGVVERAKKKGRMVDARVFADSYAIGAKNHAAFANRQQANPNAQFVYIDSSSGKPKLSKEMPKAALSIDRNALYKFAMQTIADRKELPAHIQRGAKIGARIWSDE